VLPNSVDLGEARLGDGVTSRLRQAEPCIVHYPAIAACRHAFVRDWVLGTNPRHWCANVHTCAVSSRAVNSSAASGRYPYHLCCNSLRAFSQMAAFASCASCSEMAGVTFAFHTIRSRTQRLDSEASATHTLHLLSSIVVSRAYLVAVARESHG
jgi:hypothetical protein